MEFIDRRVLGALRFADAVTGATVAAPLRVRADGVRWIRNRRGWWVIASAPGLESHALSFEAPPNLPALESVPVVVRVADDTGRYLPRRVRVRLPRTSAQARADDDDSLFRPIDVRLFRAPAAPLVAGWATVRVSAEEDGAPLGGALLRVVRASDPARVLGTGMTDARGEGVVPVPGIPATTWQEGQGGVLQTELEAEVRLFWAADGEQPPDPDVLGGGAPLRTAAVTLAAGRDVAVRL